jgi:phosphohistidine phosphatase SixA
MGGATSTMGATLEPSGERGFVLLIGHNPALHDLARELVHADLNPPVRDGGALCTIVAAV